jgi:hypothetical protein
VPTLAPAATLTATPPIGIVPTLAPAATLTATATPDIGILP